jgi:hypothetical protein
LTDLGRFLDAASSEAADGGAAGLPPVHLWNPEHCGDIGMEIRRDGSWWYAGSRIRRERMVKAFSRILRKDGDGLHYLVTPVEKVVVHVEIAPFLAVRVDAIGQGAERRLRFTTNLGDEVDAGPDRPIRVETDPETGEPRPFVRVRADLDALLTRSTFIELAGLGEPAPDDPDRLVVYSLGETFELGSTEDRSTAG